MKKLLILLLTVHCSLLTAHAQNTEALPFVSRLRFSSDFDEAYITLNKGDENLRFYFAYFDQEKTLIKAHDITAKNQQINIDALKFRLRKAVDFGDPIYFQAMVCGATEGEINLNKCGAPHNITFPFARFAHKYNDSQIKVSPTFKIDEVSLSEDSDQLQVTTSRVSSDLSLLYEIKALEGFDVLHREKLTLTGNPTIFSGLKALIKGREETEFYVDIALCPSSRETINQGCSNLEKVILKGSEVRAQESGQSEPQALSPAPLFPDIGPNSFFPSPILTQAAIFLHERGILTGYDDGTFRPETAVSRAQVSKILLTAKMGVVRDRLNNGRFSDVLNGQWFVRYIVTAAELGIINGHPDGTFRPHETVNTAEFLKMMARTFDIEVAQGPHFAWYLPYLPIADQYNLFPDFPRPPGPSFRLQRRDVAIAIYQYLKD